MFALVKTVELSDELVRQVEANASLRAQQLDEVVAQGVRLVLEQASADSPAVKRGFSKEWVKELAGVAKLAPGESFEEIKAAHHREKYGMR
jgi:hypothetical protein